MMRAVVAVRALRDGMRRFVTDRPGFRSRYAPVRVRIACRDLWPGFSVRSLLAAHPYLRLKYDLVECRRRPDVHFVGVHGRNGRDAAKIPLPKDGRPVVFYTGERVSPGAGRFDWSISYDESSARNLYLPGWVRTLNRRGLTPWSLVRQWARPAGAEAGRRGCAYIFRHRVREREGFFDRLAERMEVVAPGDSRNNFSRIGRTPAEKAAFLRHFRFDIAFENEPFPGYLTEKIVDAFVAGCVPIYCGDPHVERTFSPDAFIHVRGEWAYAEAVERILTVDGNPSLLEKMQNAAPLVDNRLPDYATHEYAMAFFERVFDSAVRRG